VLFRGIFTTDAIDKAIGNLKDFGSIASPGFMKPEGVVCYHAAGNYLFKKTIEGDEAPKGKLL